MFGDRTALNVVTGGDPAEQLAHGHRLPKDERCFRTGELMYAVRELPTGKPVSDGAAPAREGHGRDRPAPRPSLRGAGRRIRRGSRAGRSRPEGPSRSTRNQRLRPSRSRSASQCRSAASASKRSVSAMVKP
ncbi:hypothetical protein AB0M68_43620 [Streptomyces sp. NPDC051453]|uniref:hypothetical protein n=1 Tax=Streptomyces sp. NPDC051453 TaxID=3154941 RepID=UPI003419426C